MANLAQVAQHNERSRETPNADPKRRAENERLVGSGDLCADVQARLDAAGITKVRSNGIRAVEHFITASPEWFQEATPDQRRTWVDRTTDWLKGRYGNNLVSVHLHMDETTPNIHAVVVPITPDGRLAHWRMFGHRALLRAMHTDYNRAVHDLGLERGIEGSKDTHESLQHFYGRMWLPTRDAWDLARQITLAPPDRSKTIEDRLAQTIAPVIAAERTRAQYWEDRARQTTAQLQGERANRRAHEMTREEYGQLINRVRDTDLTEVIQGLGATHDRYDKNKWHIEDKELNIRGQKYFDFHAANTDPLARRGGAIDLVQYASGRTFTEAVEYLNQRYYSGRAVDIPAPERPAYVQNEERGPFQLPPNVPDRWPDVRRYLVTGRGLPADLVDQAHGRGDLYATINRSYPNAVFVRRDEDGQAVGAYMRGTRADWYGMARNSDKEAGFYSVRYGTPKPGEPPTLAVVESPIDALSYAALHRTGQGYGLVVSTDGRGPLPTHHIDQTLAEGGTVRAAFDNDGPDGGGAHLWQDMKDAYPTETSGDYTPIMRQTPKGKDWNDDLEEHLPSAERSKDTPGLDMGSGPSMGR